jgi:hypothetical protein
MCTHFLQMLVSFTSVPIRQHFAVNELLFLHNFVLVFFLLLVTANIPDGSKFYSFAC